MEGKELTTSENLPISDDDLNDFLGEVGDSASFEECIKTSTFVAENPKVEPLLLKMPDQKMVSQIIQSVDTAIFNMRAGTDRFTLQKIKMVKKLDPKNPMFPIGSYIMGDICAEPVTNLTILPLYAYSSRVYFADYDSGDRPRSICNSTNNFQGFFRGDNDDFTPYVKKCAECPYKEWGVQEDGTIDKKARTKPFCRQQFTVIGVTPEFNTLYELLISGFCMGTKEYNAHNKILTFGRMHNIFKPCLPGVPVEDVAQYRINESKIDQSTKWLNLAGKAISNKKGDLISAGTVVSLSQHLLTREQIIYASIYKKLAQRYCQYLMENFNGYLESASAQSVFDTDGDQNIQSDDVNDIEVYEDVLDTE